MAWIWRYEDADGQSVTPQDADGNPVEGSAESYPAQGDAESWLGQSFRDLQAAGVTKVVLLEDDRVEYDMSLLAG
ncbi:hypothetical protein [Longispora albida]|uniref:hypothetical protein n=1 Tax=Longispora albida TaxID=203523 RepID=UPI00036FE1A7|nr:hypothetical protein [Longispora albida]